MTLAPGRILGGRYRLERPAWEDGPGAAWEARDAVLDRPVLVQTIPEERAGAVAQAVARVAPISHPSLLQIYDVASDPPALVLEPAPGGRLADRPRRPLPPREAAAAVLQLAAGLAALHAAGVPHGAIGPATVVFDGEGRAKLAGAALVEAAGGTPPEGYRPPEPDASPEERDRYGLAAVAHRLFTGRDPADAPGRIGRRALPPVVDALLARALGSDPVARPSLEELRRALGSLAAPPPERGPGFLRQEVRWLAAVAALVAAGVAVVGVGRGPFHGGQAPTPSPTPSPRPIPVVAVHDFDPEGRPPEENPAQARFAIDGTDRGWTTLGYRTADLGRLKSGVGLVFDLGAPRAVGRIVVRTSMPGWAAEWRAADEPSRTAEGFGRVVARFTADGAPVRLVPPVTGRYWLLWITRLVDNGSGSDIPYQAQVGEVQFFAA